MTESVGIRTKSQLLRKKKKAAERYKRADITISEAAKRAEITIWEMEQFLIKTGYKSSYSIENLKEETSINE